MRKIPAMIAPLAIVLVSVAQLAIASGPPPTPEPPANVSSVGTIAPQGEPGERLVITGQVFAPDGATPVRDAIVYAYQTDATGHYQNDPQTRIARLHGWAKTDAQGRFEFQTIHPGPYPGRDIPAHVHFHVWGGGYPLQWTNELLFAGDPLLGAAALEDSKANGRFGNVSEVTGGPAGVRRCAINFRLAKRTNYPQGYDTDPRVR
jgi:protocatechuate 3,4-dioxygenase, beta subunit